MPAHSTAETCGRPGCCPLKAVASNSPTPSRPPDGAPVPTVLVVEDNEQMRNYTTGLLSPFYSIHEASNGEEALKIIEEANPDLVVTDVMMPVMNGITLLKV